MDIFIRLRGVVGILIILGLAWLMSNNKRKIPWRVLCWGLGLQVFFALVILKTTGGQIVFDFVRQAAGKLLSFSDAGAGFLFGNLYKGIDGPTPESTGWGLSLLDAKQNPIQLGTVVAFHVLPIIIFFSSLMGVFYHFGIMQKIVQGFAWVMRKTMKISGAESLSVAANVFVGMVEAPLAIKPFLNKMTLSELTCVMTGGFATVAGSVMASYIRFGVDAGHLLAASVMSAPAAVVIAKIIYPETQTPQTKGGADIHIDKNTVNFIDAAAAGAIQGLKVAAIVGAMLIAFLSLVAMVNYLLSIVGTSLSQLFGWGFAPIAWCIGIDVQDMHAVGSLLGTKISVNEFIAYLDLMALKETLSHRSFTIATYALCGFANFGSVAILIGGVGTLAPSRKGELAKLGLRTMAGGALASLTTATIAGMIIG